MKRNLCAIALFRIVTTLIAVEILLLDNEFAFASWLGAITAHPYAVQHGLPTPESPGWYGSSWQNFEFGKANIWNAPMTVQNIRNGTQLTHTADYEENRARIELGAAITSRLSVAFESSYVERNGGFMDNTIDRFHIFSGSDRFNRPLFAENQSLFELTAGGVTRLSRQQTSGFDNLRSKLKWWFLGGGGDSGGSAGGSAGKCVQCGLAIQGHVKTPLSAASTGLSSGSVDTSGMLLGGFKVFSGLSFMFNAGVESLGENESFRDWPRNQTIQIYSGALDISLGAGWFLNLEGRTNSPFMKLSSMRFVTAETDPEKIREQFVGTGWNSLVEWSTFEWVTLGRRWGKGNEITFRFQEDFSYSDGFRTSLFVTNAPDVSIVLTARFVD